MVVLTSRCPNSSWTVRISCPSSSRCVANEAECVARRRLCDSGGAHRFFDRPPENGLAEVMATAMAGGGVDIEAWPEIPIASPNHGRRLDTSGHARQAVPPGPRPEGDRLRAVGGHAPCAPAGEPLEDGANRGFGPGCASHTRASETQPTATGGYERRASTAGIGIGPFVRWANVAQRGQVGKPNPTAAQNANDRIEIDTGRGMVTAAPVTPRPSAGRPAIGAAARYADGRSGCMRSSR